MSQVGIFPAQQDKPSAPTLAGERWRARRSVEVVCSPRLRACGDRVRAVGDEMEFAARPGELAGQGVVVCGPEEVVGGGDADAAVEGGQRGRLEEGCVSGRKRAVDVGEDCVD